MTNEDHKKEFEKCYKGLRDIFDTLLEKIKTDTMQKIEDLNKTAKKHQKYFIYKNGQEAREIERTHEGHQYDYSSMHKLYSQQCFWDLGYTHFEEWEPKEENLKGNTMKGTITEPHKATDPIKDLTNRVEELEKKASAPNYKNTPLITTKKMDDSINEHFKKKEQLSVEGILEDYGDTKRPKNFDKQATALEKLLIIADYVNDGETSYSTCYPIIRTKTNIIEPNKNEGKNESPIKINVNKWFSFMETKGIEELIKDYLA